MKIPKALYMAASFISIFFLSAINCWGQELKGCVFLKGQYIEVGIAPNGAFGTPANAPDSFHARPTPVINKLFNPFDSTFALRNNAVGFVADFGRDGWDIGAGGLPGYFGDYFMPGTVQEGFSIEVNGAKGDAWSSNYQNDPSTGFSGRLKGKNTGYTFASGEFNSVWEGDMNGLTIKQSITLKENKSFFTAGILLKNTTKNAMNNIYYMRSVDPDNEVSVTSNYSTINKVEYLLPNIYNKTLVTATGLNFKESFLGLGTKDCQAKSFIVKSSLFADQPLNNIYNESNSYIYDGNLTDDVGIGIVFKIGDIAPGDSVFFSYAYILNEADLDEAFTDLQPGFIYNGTSYASGSVIVEPEDSTLTLGISNGSDFNWLWSPSTNLDTTKGTLVESKVGNGPVTYTISGTVNSGVTGRCSNNLIAITISPYPVSPPPAVLTPIKYCQNAVADPLFASGSGIIRWYTQAAGGVASSTAPTPSTKVADTLVFYVTQELDGIESGRVPVIVIIIPLPSFTISPKPVSICKGDSVLLTINDNTLNYKWSPATGLSANTGDTVMAFPLTTTTFTVNAEDSNKCSGSKDITVVIKELPEISVNPPAPAICFNDSVVLKADPGLMDYYWFPNTDLSNSNQPEVIAHPSQTTTYLLKGTGTNNCINTVSVTVKVNPLPVPLLGVDTFICKDTKAIFKPGNFASYLWNDGSSSPALEAAVPGNYWVHVTDNFNCSAADSVKILGINPLPVNFLPGDTTFCKGNIISIKIPGYLSYAWSNGETTSTGSLSKFGITYLTVKDGNGCYGKDSMVLYNKGCTAFEVPNAFTPNRDGKNDVFRPYITQIVTGYTMSVFNRWGLKIFETNEPKTGWNGYYKSIFQSAGAYIYLISFTDSDGKPVILKGTFLLLY